MKREIPQKIDMPTSRLGSQVYFTEKTGKVGSTLLRRTRSASVLGCLISLSAFGGFFPQVKTAQAFDSAPYQGLEMDFQVSQPAHSSRDLTFPATSLNSVFIESSPSPTRNSLLTPQASSDLTVSFTQSNLFRAKSVLSPTASDRVISTNILASPEGLNLDANSTLLALETGTEISTLMTGKTTLPIINVDDLLSTGIAPAGIDSRADLLNANIPEQPNLSTLPDVGGVPKHYTNSPKTEADPEQVATLSTRSKAQEPILPDNAVLPDIDLAETIISNDQNSALIESGAVVHKIKPGETLEEISRRYDISAQEIIKANDLRNANSISSFKTLRIPAHQSLSLALNSTTTSPLGAVEQNALVDSKAQNSGDPKQIEPTTKSNQPDQTQAEDLSDDSVSEGLGRQPLAVLSPSTTTKVQAPQPKLDEPESLAFRTIFPQVPSLELPPLSPADEYLPSQMLTGPQKYIWPAQGVFTSGYGWRWGRMHRGIDIAAPIGTPVVASATGTVTTAGWNDGGYGNLVEITHPDGSFTLYAHNNRLKTRVGETVYQGQQIADMGTTGRSTGPHTHFELHPAGKGAVNPVPFLRRL